MRTIKHLIDDALTQSRAHGYVTWRHFVAISFRKENGSFSASDANLWKITGDNTHDTDEIFDACVGRWNYIRRFYACFRAQKVSDLKYKIEANAQFISVTFTAGNGLDLFELRGTTAP